MCLLMPVRQELIDLKQKKQVFQTVQSILIEYENLNFNQFFDRQKILIEISTFLIDQ